MNFESTAREKISRLLNDDNFCLAYLKETRPLALSRKRDAWLLIGAAGAAIILLTLVIAALVIAANRKRAHSAVAAPPVESILKKDRGYTPTTPGFDNTGYTSETEARVSFSPFPNTAIMVINFLTQ